MLRILEILEMLESLEIFEILNQNIDIELCLKKLGKNYSIKEALEYFKDPHINNSIDSIDLMKPDLCKLNNLLVNDFGLIKFKIQNKMNHLILAYSKIK